jgi:hypothetical protein
MKKLKYVVFAEAKNWNCCTRKEIILIKRIMDHLIYIAVETAPQDLLSPCHLLQS